MFACAQCGPPAKRARTRSGPSYRKPAGSSTSGRRGPPACAMPRTTAGAGRTKLRPVPTPPTPTLSRDGEQIKAVGRAGASLLHGDVMDGRFVPNITVGLPVVKAVSRATQLPIDAHRMIVEPARYVESFVEAGAQMVSIHIEADPHAHRTLTAIRAAGAQAGIAINPATSLSVLEEAIRFVDFVLVMSVNPGFGGQEFISS